MKLNVNFRSLTVAASLKDIVIKYTSIYARQFPQPNGCGLIEGHRPRHHSHISF